MQIINSSVNDTAVTLLPDAPVNPATGMRYPTIAVAVGNLTGGVSIIDGPAGVGTVVDILGLSGIRLGYKVDFDEDNLLYVIWGDDARRLTVHDIPIADSTWITRLAFYGDPVVGADLIMLIQATGSSGIMRGWESGVVGNSSGLNIVSQMLSAPTKGAVAYITSNYNTGLMRGDIQLATLADTESGTVADTELVVNGDFATDISDWSSLLSTISFDSGTLKQVNSSAESGRAYQVVTTVAGKWYRVSVDVTAADFYVRVAIDTYGGTSSGIITIASGVTGGATVTGFFQATGTSSTVVLFNQSTTAGYSFNVDNVSITEAIPDRCVQGNHAQVIGTLTKSPVASGAELMAYSGFSTSNYAKIPYTSDFDFGTGDLCISGWLKEASNSAVEVIFERDSTTTAQRITIKVNADGTLSFICDDNSTVRTATTTLTVDDGIWRKIDCTYSGGTLTIYINGESAATATGSALLTLTNTSAEIRLGLDAQGANPLTNGNLSLFRVTAMNPTAENVKADYLEELPMFQENAKCTLSGSSANVRACSYDKSEDSYTILTDVRDKFKGLVNIEQNTLTGTAQCVASGNGRVAVGTSSQVTIEVPEINLREELAKIPTRTFTPEQFWFTGDGTKTDFDLPAGYDAWAVYKAGSLQKEGASDEYTVDNNGNNLTVSFNTAPASGADVCIMGVMK